MTKSRNSKRSIRSAPGRGWPSRCCFGRRSGEARSRQLAEVGCSANQIAAITGHATLREVERYTKAADQKRLATAAAAREAVSQKTKVEQKTGKPSGKVCQTPAQPIESKGPG